ncbi:hypothetical protein IFM89_021836 [Coptis chinensis]|uniref:Uncharacterized protein n=1 Tax=Coptis chinensis TaxID=261450 RepID=A0A835I250_9MAGN|nr:hypothetical protein IFM89_021836 [Coptis chinensis]
MYTCASYLRSLWRVSSTLFAHVASDSVLNPLGHCTEFPIATNYPSISAREFVELELAVINWKGKSEGESIMANKSRMK